MTRRGPFGLPRSSLMPFLVLTTFVLGCGGGDDLAGPPGSQDQDSDGVLDADDRCPSQAETANHWEDEDGCPDTTDELYQFARTDIEEYWLRTFATNNRSYTRAQIFRGYETTIETACGPGGPENGAFFCPLDRGIYYHVPFLDGFLEVGEYAPHFVIAHEFGHHVQNQLGFNRSTHLSIALELQADCFGGAYTGDAKARRILGDRDVEAAVVSLFRVRDRSGTPWFDPQAHGTAGQRIDFFNLGVEEGPLDCVLLLSPPPPPPPPGAASTTTSITGDSPDPSETGQSVTVVVRVTSAASTPTGTVTVSTLGGTESCSGVLANGSATCSLVFTRDGTHTLIASYVGNSSFAPSSDSEAHTVQAVPPPPPPPPGPPSASASSVSASPETITAGSGTSTITVTVRDAGNNPVSGVSVTPASSGTGNNITPASAATGTNGVATFTFSSTVAESKTITATAGGVAITDQATVTVQKMSSTVEITSDEPDPSVPNQPVTVVYKVDWAASAGTATGRVDVAVTDGGGARCDGPIDATGNGSCVLTDLMGTGQRTMAATYRGDDLFAGSTSAEITHTVNEPPPTNQAPDAQADNYQATANTTLAIPGPGLLANDSDPDTADNLFTEKLTDPTSGTVTVGSDGSFTYTPNQDFVGQDSFTYRLTDRPPGQVGLTDDATVTITINP